MEGLTTYQLALIVLGAIGFANCSYGKGGILSVPADDRPDPPTHWSGHGCQVSTLHRCSIWLGGKISR